MAWMERANIVGGAGVRDNERPGVSSQNVRGHKNVIQRAVGYTFGDFIIRYS